MPAGPRAARAGGSGAPPLASAPRPFPAAHPAGPFTERGPMTTITTPRRSRAARALALPLLVTAAIGVTACGGDSASTTTTAASATSGALPAAPDGGRGGYGGGQAGGRFGAQTEEERAKLQACLEQQGVTLPAGRPGGPGGAPGGLPGGGRGPGGAGMSTPEREKLQKAMKSCGAEVPDRGARPDGGAPDVRDATYRKSIEAYAACVRRNGFDLPKPDFSGEGPVFDPKTVDQTDATFRKASAACQSTLGRGARRGGGDSPSGGTTTTTTTPAN